MNTKEKEICFTVTDDKGKRSATWKCWSQPESGNNDIYLICREIKGAIKTSLHQSGTWRNAFSKEFWDDNFDTFRGNIEDRCLEKWSELNGIQPGIILAFCIVVPYLSINISDGQVKSKIVQVPSPPENKAVEISILITKQNTEMPYWPAKTSLGTNLIGSLVLANGDIVWVVYRFIDEPQIENLNEKVIKVDSLFFKNYNIIDLKQNNLHSLVFGERKDGIRVIIEYCVKWSANIQAQ
jgi:hypothetical protein